MAFYILNPSALTLANRYDTAVEGSVEMSDAEFAEWLAQQPQPASAEPVPAEVTRKQLFIALYRLHAITEDAIKAKLQTAYANDPASLYEALQHLANSQSFLRSHSLISGVAALFSLTSAQVDEVFVLAGKIE